MGRKAKAKKARRYILSRGQGSYTPPDRDAPIVARVAAKLERQRGAR